MRKSLLAPVAALTIITGSCGRKTLEATDCGHETNVTSCHRLSQLDSLVNRRLKNVKLSHPVIHIKRYAPAETTELCFFSEGMDLCEDASSVLTSQCADTLSVQSTQSIVTRCTTVPPRSSPWKLIASAIVAILIIGLTYRGIDSRR